MEKQINVRMSESLHLKASKAAEEKGWTTAAWIRKAIEEKLKRDQENPSADNISGFSKEEFCQIIRNVVSDELNSRGVYSGVVHGISVASDSPKFEKAKSLGQRRY
ncbi:MAG TPA: toxin-antitoxin system HicB family antitoxin [Methanocorpusculum sp.]|nr:toxin-antitoxin system HicB family antitoxin [Methanocorpusculum sp.]